VAPQPLSRNRNFVLLWVGQALSTLGAQASSIAFPLLALALTHSPAKAGLVGFANILPFPLLMLPAGVLVDRWNRKALMIVCDLGRALAMGSLGVALALGHASFAHLLVVAFVDTTFFAFFNLAEIGAMRAVVPSAQLPEAMAREGSRLYAVQLAGPPLGGFLFGLARSLPFLADAVSYAFSLAAVLLVKVPFQEARTQPPGRIREELAEGFRWLWGHAFLRTCALVFAGSNFAWNGLFLGLVVIGRRQGLSSTAIGVVIATFGALGLVGSLLAPRLLRVLSMRAIVVWGSWLACGIGLFLVHPDVWLLVVGLIPFALLNPTVNSAIIGYRVALVPDRLQGRVNGVARLLAQMGAPLGPLVMGVLLSHASARTAILTATLWMALLAAVLTVSRAIRNAPSLTELGKPAPGESDLSGTGPAQVP
jgi:MFS family permease